jgi:hypothetical protein
MVGAASSEPNIFVALCIAYVITFNVGVTVLSDPPFQNQTEIYESEKALWHASVRPLSILTDTGHI